MFTVYKVGQSAGIKFDNQLVLIAGRHPEHVTEQLVDVMNKIHDTLPNASFRDIQAFVNKHFDFNKAYSTTPVAKEFGKTISQIYENLDK